MGLVYREVVEGPKPYIIPYMEGSIEGASRGPHESRSSLE